MSNSTSTPSTPPTPIAATSTQLLVESSSSSVAVAAASSSANNVPSSSAVITPTTNAVQSTLITITSSTPVASTPEEPTTTPQAQQSSTASPDATTTSDAPQPTQASTSDNVVATTITSLIQASTQGSSQGQETTTVSGQGATFVHVSVYTITPTSHGVTLQPTTITQISTESRSGVASATSGNPTSTSSSDPSLVGNGSTSKSSGLGGGGKTAVEVVVPIAVVALLVLAGIFFWRKRKQRKDAEELRRKEVEEYGYNPNDDPSLPPTAVTGAPNGTDGPFEMREDGQGYRGWGATTVGGSSTGRKASTTLSGGIAGNTYSEGASPTHGPSDTRSGDPLVGSPNSRPLSEGSEVLGAMGPAATSNRNGDVHRGASNASSSYSAANRSDGSGEGGLPGGSYGTAQYYSGETAYGGPYGETQYGSPPGRAEMPGQPIIRENLARRATRIENPSHFPTQASTGISQNF